MSILIHKDFYCWKYFRKKNIREATTTVGTETAASLSGWLKRPQEKILQHRCSNNFLSGISYLKKKKKKCRMMSVFKVKVSTSPKRDSAFIQKSWQPIHISHQVQLHIMLHSLSSVPSINGEMAVICVWNSFMWFNMMDRKILNWWVYKEFTWNLISEDCDQVKLALIAHLTRFGCK